MKIEFKRQNEFLTDITVQGTKIGHVEEIQGGFIVEVLYERHSIRGKWNHKKAVNLITDIYGGKRYEIYSDVANEIKGKEVK